VNTSRTRNRKWCDELMKAPSKKGKQHNIGDVCMLASNEISAFVLTFFVLAILSNGA
jgi:hypothetical protein